MLRHCTMDELLAVRDHEGSAAALAHVEDCEGCRAELEKLHQRRALLRALPSVAAPRDRWSAVRDIVMAGRRRARLRWWWTGLGGLAAAAALVLMVTVGGDAPTAEAATLDQLVRQSHELEAALHEYGPEGRVMDGATAAAVAALEDRIALIDANIGAAQDGALPAGAVQVEDLWRQRVQLMDALVTTHVRQVAYVAY